MPTFLLPHPNLILLMLTSRLPIANFIKECFCSRILFTERGWRGVWCCLPGSTIEDKSGHQLGWICKKQFTSDWFNEVLKNIEFHTFYLSLIKELCWWWKTCHTDLASISRLQIISPFEAVILYSFWAVPPNKIGCFKSMLPYLIHPQNTENPSCVGTRCVLW